MSTTLFNPASRNPADFLSAGVDVSPDSAFFTPAVEPIADLSHWNTEPDFASMKAGGVETVILKASEGMAKDPAYDTRVIKALGAGLFVMPYHFFRSQIDGLAQADFHLDVIAGLLSVQQGTISWCDVETADGASNATRIARIGDFLLTISASDIAAGIYTSPALWNTLMSPTPAWISSYWQWVAAWTPASAPILPTGWDWGRTILWQKGIYNQHSWTASIPGTSPQVDYNASFVTVAQLKIIANIPQSPVPPPQPPPASLFPLQGQCVQQSLNVRCKPTTGVGGTKVGVLLNGEIVTVYAEQEISQAEVWALVKKSDNLVGWAAKIHPTLSGNGIVYL